jgi:hypothetical protein
MYVFFCQMPKTKARSGAFQKGAIRQAHGPEQSRRTYVRSNRRQGHVALHHFETAHYCECIGHYKKRHPHAHAYHQGYLCGLEERPGIVFKELKCY